MNLILVLNPSSCSSPPAPSSPSPSERAPLNILGLQEVQRELVPGTDLIRRDGTREFQRSIPMRGHGRVCNAPYGLQNPNWKRYSVPDDAEAVWQCLSQHAQKRARREDDLEDIRDIDYGEVSARN